jgi:tetratricopeptide (TPR) repeat protein/tRNA A-37 threonylcarbamoyl transferase component Bud32
VSAGADRDRWEEIDALFQRALDLPAGERVPFVHREASGDADLSEEVLALLRAAAEASDLLEAPLHLPEQLEWSELQNVLTAASAARDDSMPDRTGEQVGPYRLVRLLGRGGMASVYLGERADAHWRQHVAVKVIRRGLDTEDVIRRFIAERQILSSLQHPNIARLLDGGMTRDGLPFLVMEWVEGQSITSYCEDEGLPLAERLRLFCQIARAVEHAHRNLVVHRDLKPSNILVDGTGVPILLDFGIAKVLGADGTASDALTRTGLRVLTPEYASPEQLRGGAVTTASDVYQLGILLGLLVSGRRPNECRPPNSSRSSHAVFQATRPSRLVSDEFARSCRTTFERIRKHLRGDLDIIVLKALREDPRERYAGAGPLADDIERHLSGRPIRARPATLGYRTAKFVRRRPWVAATLVGAVAALGTYGHTLDRHARQLEAERNLARLEADRAQQVQEFLVSVFRSPDPYSAPDPERAADVTVRESLERGVASARDELADRPAILSTLLGAVADVYTSLGLVERAGDLHREALRLAQDAHGTDSREVVYRLRMLGQNRLAEGRADSALVALQRSLELARALPEQADTAEIHALQQIARAHMARGDFEEARSRLASAVSLAEKLDPPSIELLADASFLLSQVYPMLNRPGAAVRSAEQARELNSRAYGEGHPRTAIASVGLAAALVNADRGREAVPLYRQAITVLAGTLGPDHPDVIAAKGNLALSLNRLGQHREAERLQLEVLDMQLRSANGDSSQVAATMQNLAVNLKSQGRVGEAEVLLDRAYSAFRSSLPEGHYRTALPLLTLTELQLERGRFSQAEATAADALSVLSAGLPPGHYATAVARCRLGRSLTGLGRTEEGRALLERSVEEIADASATPPRYRKECLRALLDTLDPLEDRARWLELERRMAGRVDATGGR